GRGSELLELRDLLLRSEVRLVTLTGPGGIGKTRLSIETAWTMAGEYPDGVALVELASHQDPELLEEAIVAGLGARSTAAEHVGAKRMLLVLDNLEHLLDAVSAVAELLRACPRLDVLATSRERLRLSGEHV